MNPEQHVTGAPTSAALPSGEEPMIDQLLRRVQSLEEEKRRWKAVGIISLALLLLGIVGGGAVVGLAAISSLGAGRYQQQRLRAFEDMAEQQRAVAEQQRQDAQRKFEEAERQRGNDK